MGPVRTLRHGTIDHGEQFLLPQNQRFATTYYAANSGVGLAIRKLQTSGPINVGVIGLGAGTIATYARPVDHYTFYDINPLVLHIARTQFRFLRDCMAPNEVVLGDARLVAGARAIEAVRRAGGGCVFGRCDSGAFADQTGFRSFTGAISSRMACSRCMCRTSI